MSANFQTPGLAYDHWCMPVKGYQPDYPLDCRGSMNTAVTATVNSGLVMYAGSVTQLPRPFPGQGPKLRVFSLGCAIIGPPVWIWNGLTEPDTSNIGVPVGIPALGQVGYPPNWVSVLPGYSGATSQQIWGLVGMPGLELETTEFDTTQTYTPGQPLRAVTSNTIAHSGMITNQNTSTTDFNSAGPVVPGTDTVVGIVSAGSYTNSYRRVVLSLYTYFQIGTR